MRERVVTETQSFVFQMCDIDEDGARLKRLNRRMRRWLEREKENEETEFFEELVEIRLCALAGLKLYRRLCRQTFVHHRDEYKLFELAERAVKKFNAFVLDHSTPPDTNEFIPFDEL